MKNEILKVTIGSQAHGLATPESDTDYRSVFIAPTKNFFLLGSEEKGVAGNTKIEGSIDDTSYEIGDFIAFATKSNPSIMEVFRSPIEHVAVDGYNLLDLFPHTWSGIGVYNAYRGYGHNQRNRMIENKDGKMHKFATSWLRTIYNALCLFDHGDFSMSVIGTPIEHVCKRWKSNHTANIQRLLDPLTAGEVIDTVTFWETALTDVYESSIMREKKTDYDVINSFLVEVRKDHFD